VGEVHVEPSGPITPTIDGEITSYFEWIGAGLYRVDERSGSMHGKKLLVKEVYYGVDAGNFYLRLDLHATAEPRVEPIEARLTFQAGKGATSSASVGFAHGLAQAREVRLAVPDGGAPACAFGRVLEIRIPLASLEVAGGGPLNFQMSLWQGGLPMDAVPQQGWIQMANTNPDEWLG
jgi:hypothetical protein